MNIIRAAAALAFVLSVFIPVRCFSLSASDIADLNSYYYKLAYNRNSEFASSLSNIKTAFRNKDFNRASQLIKTQIKEDPYFLELHKYLFLSEKLSGNCCDELVSFYQNNIFDFIAHMPNQNQRNVNNEPNDLTVPHIIFFLFLLSKAYRENGDITYADDMERIILYSNYGVSFSQKPLFKKPLSFTEQSPIDFLSFYRHKCFIKSLWYMYVLSENEYQKTTYLNYLCQHCLDLDGGQDHDTKELVKNILMFSLQKHPEVYSFITYKILLENIYFNEQKRR